MDALELLKKDHDRVHELLEKAINTTERAVKTREELFLHIDQELSVHAKMEETLFYPVLKEFEALRELVLEANEEHNVIRILLKELKNLPYESEKWKARLTVLKENVEHHVKEEENDIFPKVEKELTSAALESMAQAMQEFKRTHKK